MSRSIIGKNQSQPGMSTIKQNYKASGPIPPKSAANMMSSLPRKQINMYDEVKKFPIEESLIRNLFEYGRLRPDADQDQTSYLETNFAYMPYIDGSYYCGFVDNNGLREGKGFWKFSPKNSPSEQTTYFYIGGFRKDAFEGPGRLIEIPLLRNYTGTLVYDGQWREWKKDGKGLYMYKNSQNYYNGCWKDDRKHGQGVLVYDDTIFTGLWENNRRSEGELVIEQEKMKIVCTGKWQEDQIREGKILYFDKEAGSPKFLGEYKGKIKGGLRDGEAGQFNDGNFSYIGNFKQDNVAEGELRILQKFFINGSFANGFPEGTISGKLFEASGNFFDGNIIYAPNNQSRPHEGGRLVPEYGKYKRINGDITEGNFLTQKGKFTFYDAKTKESKIVLIE